MKTVRFVSPASGVVPAYGWMRVVCNGSTAFRTTVGACVPLDHAVNPTFMITTIEGTRKAIARLLSIAAAVVPTQVLLCIVHFVHLTLVAQNAGDRGECLVGTIRFAAPKWPQVGVDMFTSRM